MNLRKKITVSLLAAILSLPVCAMSLNEAMSALGKAKSSGSLGEQANGYLGIVKADGNAAEVAKLINDARKKEYQAVAQKNGITLGDVEKMAAEKAQERTPAGQFIQVGGQWKKK